MRHLHNKRVNILPIITGAAFVVITILVWYALSQMANKPAAEAEVAPVDTVEVVAE